MEVILLEKVHQLGSVGDRVKVRPGYGRNYLIPMGKAVPADFMAQLEELQDAVGRLHERNGHAPSES